MTAVLFDYPKSATFGRVLPKNKIYEHGNPNATVRQLFVKQVEQVVWQYKLAPETIKLPARPAVPEIQVFSIALKTPQLHEDVLKCIDNAIQFPILFELHFEGLVQAKACYKRPALSSSQKSMCAEISQWVSSDYFATQWQSEVAARVPLPVALDMAALYEQLLRRLIPLVSRSGETIVALVERAGQVRRKQKEVEQTKARLSRARQFNRKVEFNAMLRNLYRELEELS